MKYLKPYKIFEDYGIKQEIGDLIANLTDDGYHTTIIEREVNDHNLLVITIDKRVESNKSYIPPEDLTPFPWIIVRPEIQRMVEYLKDRYFLHKTKLYKSIDRYGKADSEMFSFDYVIPMVGTDNLNIRKIEMTFVKEDLNESRDIKYDITESREKEIYNIVDDCLVDITDNDNSFRIVRALADDYERVNMSNELLGMELHVTLHNYNSFNLKDIIDPINNLISQLSGEHIELKEINYKYNENEKNKHGYGSRWYQMSMDPIDNMIRGNTILPSDLVLKSIRLVFV